MEPLKKRKYSQKTLVALQRTVRAYRRLIATTEKEESKWKDYGLTTSCRLCHSVGILEGLASESACARCPLNGSQDWYGCVDSADTRTHVRLKNELRWPGSDIEGEDVSVLAQARLNWILQRARESGVGEEWLT